MNIQEVVMLLPKETEMGNLVTLTVTNRADRIRFEDGTIAGDRVRSVKLNDVLVDTGATTLCLPSNIIAELGLKLLKEVDVTTMGISQTRIFKMPRYP
jgi:hypothetical protein